MKIVGRTIRGLSKNLFDSYGYFYFDDGPTYRKQDTQYVAKLIRQIKRKA